MAVFGSVCQHTIMSGTSATQDKTEKEQVGKAKTKRTAEHSVANNPRHKKSCSDSSFFCDAELIPFNVVDHFRHAFSRQGMLKLRFFIPIAEKKYLVPQSALAVGLAPYRSSRHIP